MSDSEKATLFERLKKGLEESIAYSRGELSLRTTVLPAPPPPASPTRVRALRILWACPSRFSPPPSMSQPSWSKAGSRARASPDAADCG